jgi:hypothetical protein
MRIDMTKTRESLNGLPFGPGLISIFFGCLSFLLRLPFLFRYDLHFGGDSATCYLMALRILGGDRPLYFYGQDYQGAAEAYLAAGLFKIFGPSIPLAGTVSLMEWALAVGIGVYLLMLGTSKFHSIIGGLFAAVAVPYTLHYVAVPYWGYPGGLLLGMMALLPACFILEKGPTPSRFILLGLISGFGLFVGKQCVPGLTAAFLTLLILKSKFWDWRKWKSPAWTLSTAFGFLIGYSPEIAYRLSHYSTRDFSGSATPVMIWNNFRNMLKSIPAFFDAQPISRSPEAVYYFIKDMHGLIYPRSPLDIIYCVLGFWVLWFAFLRLRKSFNEKNTPLFLLTALLFINITAVIISRQTNGEFSNARRYLYSSAIVFSLFTGYFLADALLKNSKRIPILAACLGIVFIARVFIHEFFLLTSPNELREIRWVIADMKSQGFDRGLANWGTAYIADAMTNQQTIIAGNNGERIPEYTQKVSQADRIGVIGLKSESIEKDIIFGGKTYRQAGPPRENETFRWIPYQQEP